MIVIIRSKITIEPQLCFPKINDNIFNTVVLTRTNESLRVTSTRTRACNHIYVLHVNMPEIIHVVRFLQFREPHLVLVYTVNNIAQR